MTHQALSPSSWRHLRQKERPFIYLFLFHCGYYEASTSCSPFHSQLSSCACLFAWTTDPSERRRRLKKKDCKREKKSGEERTWKDWKEEINWQEEIQSWEKYRKKSWGFSEKFWKKKIGVQGEEKKIRESNVLAAARSQLKLGPLLLVIPRSLFLVSPSGCQSVWVEIHPRKEIKEQGNKRGQGWKIKKKKQSVKDKMVKANVTVWGRGGGKENKNEKEEMGGA